MTTVIILAAGEGSRLRPYTLNKPKCLVSIDGQAMLDYQLDVLRSVGLEDIVVVTGYMGQAIDHPGIRYYRNARFAETNMVWTLFCARPELETDDVIVSYGDIIYSISVVRSLLDSPHEISVVVDRAWLGYWRERFENPLDDAETLELDELGRIIDIGCRATSADKIQGQYIGLTRFRGPGLRTLLDEFDRGRVTGNIGDKTPEKAYMTDLLRAIIRGDHKVYPVFIEGQWLEIDTIKDLFLPATLARLHRINQDKTQG